MPWSPVPLSSTPQIMPLPSRVSKRPRSRKSSHNVIDYIYTYCNYLYIKQLYTYREGEMDRRLKRWSGYLQKYVFLDGGGEK